MLYVSTLIPIKKKKLTSLSDSNNYRVIVLNSLFGKIMDACNQYIVILQAGSRKHVFSKTSQTFMIFMELNSIMCHGYLYGYV